VCKFHFVISYKNIINCIALIFIYIITNKTTINVIQIIHTYL
jgi:hypothetical protein